MNAEEYLRDPCRASSLPFWKTEKIKDMPGVSVIREDLFHPAGSPGPSEPYFKMICRLEHLDTPCLPAPYETMACDSALLADHINACYGAGSVTPNELDAYNRHPVYDPELWIAVYDPVNGKIIASGIAEFDKRIGEGVLEWIQVSPGYRRRGLGKYIVCELLRRMQGKADFVTVSGKADDPCKPALLYRSCGFTDSVIWHVIRLSGQSVKKTSLISPFLT